MTIATIQLKKNKKLDQSSPDYSAEQELRHMKTQRLPHQFVPAKVAIFKRWFDVAAAGAGLLMVLPLFPLIALAIKLESRGPVFFKQLRIGQALPSRTDVFMMIKFRTMAADAEKRSGPVLASKNDCRVTRVGKFLRKTRLDELPQFLNVLRGEMSLIGPRPERPSFCNRLEKQIPYFTDRTYGLKPGITGLSQIYQGYDESLEDVKNKLGYDLSYTLSLNSVWNWLKADISIVFGTIKVMILGRGQ